MISLETTAKVRRDHFVHDKSIKQICLERGISRNSVRKILRSGDTTFQYERAETPMPKLGAFVERLEVMLKANETRAKRDRVRLTRIFDDLRREGYEGGDVRGPASRAALAAPAPWRRRPSLHHRPPASLAGLLHRRSLRRHVAPARGIHAAPSEKLGADAHCARPRRA